jgi:hypothetical protein
VGNVWSRGFSVELGNNVHFFMFSRVLSIKLKASFDSESVLVLVRKVLRSLVNIMYAKKGN